MSGEKLSCRIEEKGKQGHEVEIFDHLVGLMGGGCIWGVCERRERYEGLEK